MTLEIKTLEFGYNVMKGTEFCVVRNECFLNWGV